MYVIFSALQLTETLNQTILPCDPIHPYCLLVPEFSAPEAEVRPEEFVSAGLKYLGSRMIQGKLRRRDRKITGIRILRAVTRAALFKGENTKCLKADGGS
jgi:hypothetical protein